MFDRRASDGLWRELRDAVLAVVAEHNAGARESICVDEDPAIASGLRLRGGQRCLELQGSRDAVTCTLWTASDPDSRTSLCIGLRPGVVPSFRLDGHAEPAPTVAARLLMMFLGDQG